MVAKRKARGDHRKHKTRPRNITRRVKEATARDKVWQGIQQRANNPSGTLSLDMTARDYLECREG